MSGGQTSGGGWDDSSALAESEGAALEASSEASLDGAGASVAEADGAGSRSWREPHPTPTARRPTSQGLRTAPFDASERLARRTPIGLTRWSLGERGGREP